MYIRVLVSNKVLVRRTGILADLNRIAGPCKHNYCGAPADPSLRHAHTLTLHPFQNWETYEAGWPLGRLATCTRKTRGKKKLAP